MHYTICVFGHGEFKADTDNAECPACADGAYRHPAYQVMDALLTQGACECNEAGTCLFCQVREHQGDGDLRTQLRQHINDLQLKTIEAELVTVVNCHSQ